MTNDDETRSQNDGEAGGTLLGAPSRRGPMNVFPFWKYMLIGVICLLGTIYAAPNVFQPDPAVQIRALDSDDSVGVAQRAQVTAALSDANIGVIAIEEDVEDAGFGKVLPDFSTSVAAHEPGRP